MIKSEVTSSSHYKKRGYSSRIRYLSLMYVILLSFLIQIPVSVAQTTSYPNTLISIPHPITSLLRSKKVHRELRLSETEINEVEKVISQFELPLWRLRDLPPQKRNEAAAPLINQLNNKLTGILSVRQKERLSQLVRQAGGFNVMLDPQIILRLNLTPEQINAIRALINTLYNKINALQNNPDISSVSQRASYIQTLHIETQTNIQALLNNYQRNTFATLTGRPFNFSQVRNIACKAPEFEIDIWLNSPPVKLSEQKGKVTVVHFYAFGCGNCIRTLPYYNDWKKHFPKNSFSIIAIHRPETEQERNIEKVKEKAAQAHMEYPIAIDNDSLAWNSWANNIWPSIYLLDKNGFVRYWWYGELNYQGAESEKLLRKRIQELINEPWTPADTALN